MTFVLTSGFGEYSGVIGEQMAGSGGNRLITLTILSDMQVMDGSGCSASLSKMRCVPAARMGNIAGTGPAGVPPRD